MTTSPDGIILSARNLTKEFKGFIAVRRVNLQVRRGTIHALIGPNGAGKTTVFNLLTKFLIPSAGRSCSTAATSPGQAGRHRAARAGALVPDLGRVPAPDLPGERTGRAAEAPRGDSFDFWRSETTLRDWTATRRALLETVNLAAYRDTAAVELSYGRKRALEIATTLALDPELMLLDEPMAGMGHEDIDRTAELIRQGLGQPHDPDGRAQPVASCPTCRTGSRCWRAARFWPRGRTPRCRRTRG